MYWQVLPRGGVRPYPRGVDDHRTEISDFLRTRRARISPEQAQLFAYGGHRRVPGLRREEVAMLAGVSVDYYARLERGNLSGVSDEVLGAIGRALQLDEAESAHLFDLARAARGSARPRRAPQRTQRVRPSVQRLLDAWTAPAWVRNDRMDLLATNQLGAALYAPILESPLQPPNNARFAFLDPRATEFYVDWEQGANDLVAILRSNAGRNPEDRALRELIGELSTKSEVFRSRWANHNVRFHRTGLKRLRHPVVGDLELEYEAFELPADPGLTMFAYTAQPGSPTEERLKLLASWAASEAAVAAAMEAEVTDAAIRTHDVER